jgi:hypothetical protein
MRILSTLDACIQLTKFYTVAHNAFEDALNVLTVFLQYFT